MAYARTVFICSGPTDAALTLSGIKPVPPTGTSATIDGLHWNSASLVIGMTRILLLSQGGSLGAAAASNGVWIFQGQGNPMSRPSGTDEYATTTSLDNATLIEVRGPGAAFGGTCWGVEPAQVITVDTTSHALTRVSLPDIQARVATTGQSGSVFDVTMHTYMSVDGTTLSGNGTPGSDVVLVTDQGLLATPAPQNNGVYWANTGGAMNRATEPLNATRRVLVSEGALNAHSRFELVTTGPIAVGTTPLTFSPQNVVVNVKDFGATGVGSSPDGAAINTALTTPGAGTLFFPVGTYLVNNTSTFTVPAGMTTQFANGSRLLVSGTTVTINGPIVAGDGQTIFDPTSTGTYSNPTLTGSSTGVLSASLTSLPTTHLHPSGSFLFRVTIVVGGNPGPASFNYSLDAGHTYSLPIPTAVSYAIPGTGITITFGSGTYVTGDYYSFTSSAPVMLGATNARPLTPMWWGAVGDGVNDDRPALQAAIAAVGTIGGGTVLVSPGKYAITNSLYILSDFVMIAGASKNSVSILPTGTFATGTVAAIAFAQSRAGTLPAPGYLEYSGLRDLAINFAAMTSASVGVDASSAVAGRFTNVAVQTLTGGVPCTGFWLNGNGSSAPYLNVFIGCDVNCGSASTPITAGYNLGGMMANANHVIAGHVTNGNYAVYCASGTSWCWAPATTGATSTMRTATSQKSWSATTRSAEAT